MPLSIASVVTAFPVDTCHSVANTKPVRLAVVGAGLIGSKHARLIRAQSGCALVGIGDFDSNRKPVAEEFNVPFYEDVESLLDREVPEGVIVATPNGTHAVIAELCSRRSMHVLIEKPIAATLEDAQHIVKLAADSKIQVLVGHHRRYNPLIQETRSIVQSGVLGRLVAVSMLWTLLKPPDYYEVGWRCRRPDGGPALINLIHELDSLRFICGEIRQVYAQASCATRKLDVEDSLSITLSFANGSLGSVLASDATPSPWSYEAATGENPYYFHADENCYHFLGTLGSLAFPRMELWRYSEIGQAGWQYPLDKSCRAVTKSDPLIAQLKHFCRVVRGEESPMVDGQEGTRSLAVALAVLESIERQAPVALH